MDSDVRDIENDDEGFDDDPDPHGPHQPTTREPYRPARPTRLVIYGGIALVSALGLIAALSWTNNAAAPYAWAGTILLASILLLAIRHRLSERRSQHVQIDDQVISWVGPEGFRSLPWTAVDGLRIGRRGAIEVFDASRTVVLTLTRKFERFPELVAEALGHLEAAYPHRIAGGRSRPLASPMRFASSVVPEAIEALGSVAFTAASAWWSTIGFVLGLLSMPVTFRRLGRMPYAVTAGRTVALETMIGTLEIPMACVSVIALRGSHTGRVAVVVEESTGQATVIPLSRVTERPLELYDRLRRLHEAQTPSEVPCERATRIVPARAAVFSAGCAVVALATMAAPIVTGRVLHFAAERGIVELARVALLLGSPLDRWTIDRTTPLYAAAKAGHLPVVQLLLDRGADGSKRSRDMGFTPLHVSAEHGHMEIVRTLLRSGVSPDVRNNWEQTPLWQVSWQPHDAVVTTAGILLDAGASIDAADRDGFAPLHTAVRHANLPLVEYLVSRGARHDIRTKRGTTAASMAVIHECGDCLRLLANAGADVDERDEDGSTLLYAAAARGKRDLVVSLVAAGARTDASSNGYNAVQIAAWLGHREVVEALLQGPADPNLTSEPTKVGPALNLAVERKHLDVVRVLLENGARWDIPFNGYTALQRAAWQGEVEMVAAMLDRGVSPDAGSSTHPPPLVLAAERGAIGVVRLLVERGADVNVSFQGWTALRAARRRSHTDVIAYLGANGAR